MCSGVKNIISSVVRAVKKVWDFVRKYLAIIVFVIALFFPVLWPMVSTYLPASIVAVMNAAVAGSAIWGTAAWSWTALAVRGLVGLGFAYFLSSDAASAIVDKLADVGGFLTESVVEVGTSVVGGVASGLLSSPFGWAIIGVGLYLLLRSKEDQNTLLIARKDEDKKPVEQPAKQDVIKLSDGTSFAAA